MTVIKIEDNKLEAFDTLYKKIKENKTGEEGFFIGCIDKEDITFIYKEFSEESHLNDERIVPYSLERIMSIIFASNNELTNIFLRLPIRVLGERAFNIARNKNSSMEEKIKAMECLAKLVKKTILNEEELSFLLPEISTKEEEKDIINKIPINIKPKNIM